MEEIIKLVLENYPTLIKESFFECGDGITYMFMIENDYKIYRCYFFDDTTELVFLY